MKRVPFLCILLTVVGFTRAQDAATSPSPSPAPPAPSPTPMLRLPHQSPDVAAPKVGPDGKPSPGFLQRHAQLVETAKKGDIDLYFLGDSITARWEKAPDLWKKTFGAWKPGNFGISGDRTQHVLWRIENGELTGVNPKVVVLMIGTNNADIDTPEDTARGVEKIVANLREKLPQTKILLLAIFPRGPAANDPRRLTNEKVNAIISKLGDDKQVFFLDIGAKFLQPDGTLSKDIMPDLLHPNSNGYQVWADAMTPRLAELMK